MDGGHEGAYSGTAVGSLQPAETERDQDLHHHRPKRILEGCNYVEFGQSGWVMWDGFIR